MTDAPKHDGRRRVIIENVQPEIESGRFPVKRVVGQNVGPQKLAACMQAHCSR